MMDDENNLPAILEPDCQEETIAIARGICPYAERLSDEAILICVAFVELEGDEKKVSQHLGSRPAYVGRVIRSHLSQRVIADLSRIDLVGTGLLIAVTTLKKIAKLDGASPAARIKAAIELRDMAEMQKNKTTNSRQDGGKSLNEYSLKELEETVEAFKQNITFIDQQSVEVIEGDLIDQP